MRLLANVGKIRFGIKFVEDLKKNTFWNRNYVCIEIFKFCILHSVRTNGFEWIILKRFSRLVDLTKFISHRYRWTGRFYDVNYGVFHVFVSDTQPPAANSPAQSLQQPGSISSRCNDVTSACCNKHPILWRWRWSDTKKRITTTWSEWYTSIRVYWNRLIYSQP